MNRQVTFYHLVWRKKSSLLALVFATCGLGIFGGLFYQQFIYLQAQNTSGLSAFNEIVLPLSGLCLAAQLFIGVLVAAQLAPSLNAAGHGFLIQLHRVSSLKLIASMFAPLMLFSLWPLLVFLTINLLLLNVTTLDITRLALTICGLLLINLISSLIVFAICFTRRRQLLAIIYTLIVISIIFGAEAMINFYSMKLQLAIKDLGIFRPFIQLREGILVYANIVSYAGWIFIAIAICLLNYRRQRLLPLASFYWIILTIGGLQIVAANFIDSELDLTADKRNSVSSTYLSQLQSITDRLQLTAVIDKETSREEILRGFRILQQAVPQAEISFKARQSLPPELQHAGQYVQFSVANLSQIVAYPFDHDVKNVFESAVIQMLNRKQQWITFIEGHGESSPLGKSASDLGQFYQGLKSLGWPVAIQDLTKIPYISDNTGLVVIASSKLNWPPTEISQIINYLQGGGNLLLLVDPVSNVPTEIESFIGIKRVPGTLVDWHSYQNGTPHPAIVVVSGKSIHPAASGLGQLLAFPWASGLQFESDQFEPHIEIQPVVNVKKEVWSELNIDADQLSFDSAQGEVQGAFPVAVSRFDKRNNQKIMVVGDSHFLSDSAINNYANEQFAFNIVSWLTNNRLAQSRSLFIDNSIQPSAWINWSFNWLFSLLMPLGLMVVWYLSPTRRLAS